jgi:hypothetical protein
MRYQMCDLVYGNWDIGKHRFRIYFFIYINLLSKKKYPKNVLSPLYPSVTYILVHQNISIVFQLVPWCPHEPGHFSQYHISTRKQNGLCRYIHQLSFIFHNDQISKQIYIPSMDYCHHCSV